MITVTTLEDGILMVNMEDARLDAINAPDVHKQVIARLTSANGRIVFNMGRVLFIDSSGLGVLVSILKRVMPLGDLWLCGLDKNVLKTLKLTRLDSIFSISPTVEAALNTMRG